MISKSILKMIDAVAQSIELHRVRNTDYLDKTMRVMIYNIALQEMYNMLIIAQKNFYLTSTTKTFTNVSGGHWTINMDNVSDIYSIEKMLITDDLFTKSYYTREISFDDFSRLLTTDYGNSSSHDYEFVYTIEGNTIHSLRGNAITIDYNEAIGKIYYHRFPQYASISLSNYDTLLVDLPAIYENILILRMASLWELLEGGKDVLNKLVQVVYDKMIAQFPTTIQNQVLQAIQNNESLVNDLQRNTAKGI